MKITSILILFIVFNAISNKHIPKKRRPDPNSIIFSSTQIGEPEESADSEELPLIIPFAKIAHDAAYDESKMKDFFKNEGFELFNKAGFRYAIGQPLATPDTIVIVFRGTVPSVWENLIADLTPELTHVTTHKEECKECKVSIGFKTAFKTLRKQLRQDFSSIMDPISDQINHIYISGHSLGGALATLCAYDTSVYYRKKGYIKAISLVTFGSTRVGDANFAKYMNEKADLHYNVRFSYKEDPIPDYPGITDEKRNDSARYEHVGTEVNFSDYKNFTVKEYNKDDRKKNGFWSVLKSLYHKAKDHSEYRNIEDKQIKTAMDFAWRKRNDKKKKF